MSEIVDKIIALESLGKDLHWFCPRSSPDDSGCYFDEDCLQTTGDETSGSKAAAHVKVQEAENRRTLVLEACQILAFEGPEAAPFQKRLTGGLQVQLTRCDICIREYHRARSRLERELEGQYEVDEVSKFMAKYDKMNIERICAGLDTAMENLYDLPPDKRSITACGEVGMYAVFEALNCGPFLRDEEALLKFDGPFRLAQSNRKKIKLTSYVPGMAAFLYSHNSDRSSWAYRSFSAIKRPLAEPEFEYSVKPFLEVAMSRVNVGMLDFDFLVQFWKGTRLIISKMTKELVVGHLRPMETNIYTQALEHFQIDNSHFEDLIASYQLLLELAPSAFWDAMGGITPQAVAENIFRSPGLEHDFKVTENNESLHLKKKLSWVQPFLGSIKAANIIPPIRTILNQLLHGFQSNAYSSYAHNVTWDTGLECLLDTVMRIKQLGGGPVVLHLIEVVAEKHIQVIMQELDGIEKKEEIRIDRTESICLEIVENLLALDVQSLVYDRREILKTRTLDHDIGLSGLHIWKMTMRVIKPGHPALATSVLSGVKGLLLTEPFTKKQVEASPKYAGAWNQAQQRTSNYIRDDLLERLESFSPEQLVELYQEQSAAQGLVALLFSGEQLIHQTALNILKILSGEDNRRDSLMHLVRIFLGTTLSAAAEAQKIIAHSNLFGPCPTLLKLSMDIMSCLCDSQDGVLRSDSIATEGDLTGLEQFWQETWAALETIFAQTETWSALGYDKGMLQDFCRATMDFADYAFDQYSIFDSKLQRAARDDAQKRSKGKVGKRLLEFPTKAFGVIIKWLRLRDEYLIAKAVGLTSKILLRLQEVGIEIDGTAAQYIEDIVMSVEKQAKIRTKLTMAQKAELQRALERHLGGTLSSIIDIDAAAPKKHSRLAHWASSGGSGTSTPSGDAPKHKSGVIDVDAWSAANNKNRGRREEKDDFETAYADLIDDVTGGQAAYRQRMQPKAKPSMPASTRMAQKHQHETKNFLEKRKAEQEALKKQRDAALVKAKGVGAGSGVAGLGDMGMDHSTKGQSVMVSSDEEESDEDDELDNDLFGINKMERKKIVRPNVDPNGALGLKPEVKKGPTRIQRTQRSLKDMRARLAPDLQPLHKAILTWEFFHTGDYPPGAQEHIFKEVAKSYNDPISYQETFQPLLTLEAWQNMVKSREENTARPYTVNVSNRSNVDAFIEIGSLVSHVENRELQLQEGDLILLSKASRPADDPNAPHCLARIYRVKRQKAHCEVVYQLLPQTSFSNSLTTQAVVYGLKIQSLTTLEREYAALQGLQYYDLCQQIIRAAPSKGIQFSEKQIAAFQDVWNVNRAQSVAISAALENEGFSLIQGPPGSGKTKTIVSIVGGLLSQSLTNTAIGGMKISMPKANGNQSAGSGGDATARKLLVCAPSNAAVDELVIRLKEGVKTRNGKHHLLNVVRIGRSDAINTQALDVTMDELVAKRLGNSHNGQAMRERNSELFKEHEKISGELKSLYEKRDSGDVKGKELTILENEIVSVRKRKNELGVRIDNAKDQERNAGREVELNRKKAQQAVLDEAHVICATLSGSGHDMFQSLNIEFETVIIDEAAQCVEMSSLVPLKYGCIKCVMVGDPKQLPPTVFSKEAAKFQFEQSLFVRMQSNFPKEVHLLDTQYRMHPEISVFPSRTFYDGLLKDGDGMAALRHRPWHSSALLAPYRFFDVRGQHQAAPRGHSLVNLAEVDVAIALFERLTTDFKSYDFTGRVGIITPYKSQLKALKERFSGRFGNGIFDRVEFNTTDAFQGRESEVIIFSCVRASPAGGIGFLQDIRRMNVGLTRAKSSLWVLGNSESLMRGRFWKRLVEDAQERDCHTTGDVIAMLRKPSNAYPTSMTKTHSMFDVSGHVSQMDGIDSTQTRSANGSLRTLREQDGTPHVASRGQPEEHRSGSFRNKDRIERSRHRYEDIVADKRQPLIENSKAGSRRSSLQPPDQISEDVEMKDADVAPELSGIAMSYSEVPSAKSRAETPSSGEERVNGSVTGSTKPVPGVPTVAQLALKKRPAASPFLPAKKNKPKR